VHIILTWIQTQTCVGHEAGLPGNFGKHCYGYMNTGFEVRNTLEPRLSSVP
jgi:hypothetical protein